MHLQKECHPIAMGAMLYNKTVADLGFFSEKWLSTRHVKPGLPPFSTRVTFILVFQYLSSMVDVWTYI